MTMSQDELGGSSLSCGVLPWVTKDNGKPFGSLSSSGFFLSVQKTTTSFSACHRLVVFFLGL
jgi:hypothetical protein